MTTHHEESRGHHAPMSDEQFLKEHESELSRSAQHAKWIHSPNEHEDHPGQTPATRSHEVI